MDWINHFRVRRLFNLFTIGKTKKGNHQMKLFIKSILLIYFVSVISACSKVPAGYVGIKVYLLGGSKGVETEELGVGRYWIGINEELYNFPTFTQNYVWTKDVSEGSRNDESFTFQTMEGMTVGADIGISYYVNPEKVTSIFEKYRKGVDEITDIYLRNMTRDALVRSSSIRSIKDVYGIGKSDLINEVEQAVKEQVEEIGIIIEKIYWIGELRLPEAVTHALNSKIRATQMAQQRENEVSQTIAEAKKVREEAKGNADAILLVAKAEAEAIEIKAKALRGNPDVLKLEAINKWNGELSKFNGSEAVPFIEIK